jgi:cell division transport system permease protein
LSGIVLIISIIIISNTIRLTIYSKKELIRALELIGATSLFIQVPFLVEAMLHGLIGAVLAIITLMVSVMFVNANLSVMYGISFELNGIVIALSLSGIGIFISLIGSQRAIARFLK